MTVFLSYLFGLFSKITWPRFFAQVSIRVFAKAFGISFKNARKKKFSSLYDMFTREINRDLSHLTYDSIIHPVDGRLVSFGKVSDGQVFLIKGKNYSLKELLGKSYKDFSNHYFYNYYLSPKDYHRVHHPVSGKHTESYFIKGPLYPVADWFVKLCPSVFAKNARTVSVVESKTYGKTAMVMVGAYNVGSLEMKKGFFEEGSFEVKAGDHLGTFGLGSSVVFFIDKALKAKEGESLFGSEIS